MRRISVFALFTLVWLAGPLLQARPHKTGAKDIDRLFSSPEMQYRPYVRWWWNGDRVEPAEIIRELGIMHDAGIGGVEISPIEFPSGADTVGRKALDYLSPEWLECLRTAFDETRRLGMGCDLLVGSGWPFGAESLPKEDRASILITTADSLTSRHLEISKFALIKQADPLTTVTNPRRTAEVLKVMLVPQGIGSLEDAIDVSDRFRGDILDIDIPEGVWWLYSLIRFDSFASVINGAPGAAGSQIDYMNAGAIRRYLDNMAGRIEAETGPLSGHLRAFFVDNMELEGCNWTADFAEEFLKRRGYDIMPWFPYIMFKMGRLGDVSEYRFGAEKTPEFENLVQRARYDFEITRMELNYERYTRTFLAWCKEKGVKARAQAYGRGFWPLDSSLGYDIPEGESWTTNWLRHRLGEEMGDDDYRRGRGYTMVNKYVSSAAHLAGKRIVSAEEMTNTYKVFNVPLEFIKVGSDMAAFSGITHSVWHGFNYSPLDAPFPGWVQYGTFHNERNTWWPFVKHLNDYRARLSAILQNTDMVTDIAILPPNGDLWSELGAQNEPFPAALNISYTSMIWEAVHKNGGGADYVSEGILRDAIVKDGRLCYGPKAYRELLIVENKGIDEGALAKIEAFVRGGGRVFCIACLPHKSLGLKDFSVRDEAIKTKVDALLRAFPQNFILLPKAENNAWLEWYSEVQTRYGLPHSVSISNPDRFLLQNHYRADDGSHWYLFSNASFSARQSTTLEFDPSVCKGRKAWVYNPADGRKYSLKMDGNKVQLELGPSETVVISFSRLGGKAPEWKHLPLRKEAGTKLCGWTVELRNPQVDTLIRFECDTLADLKDSHPAFMGTATYTASISLSDSIPSYIDLGRVCDIAELRINGQDAGLRWWGDSIFETGGLLHEGENTIEVRVTTMMGNYVRSLGSDNSAARRFILRRDHPLVSAGLLGPVVLY